MATMKGREAVYADIQTKFGLIPKWVDEIPTPALTGFWSTMADFYLAETAIPNKYKDLIGIAVSGATRCKYCALFHTEGAKMAGATAEEIAEASMMGGLTMMASTFINAQQVDYDQFAKETRQIVDYVKKQMAAQPRTTPPHAQAK